MRCLQDLMYMYFGKYKEFIFQNNNYNEVIIIMR